MFVSTGNNRTIDSVSDDWLLYFFFFFLFPDDSDSHTPVTHTHTHTHQTHTHRETNTINDSINRTDTFSFGAIIEHTTRSITSDATENATHSFLYR